jgi:hypothetical protein
VSILCSAYIPKWFETKTITNDEGAVGVDLAHDFHSPSYEFTGLRQLFETLGKPVDLSGIKHAVKKCWSFNSTIHLPWSAENAGLSNGLMGKITNQAGDSAMRFGAGFGGKSIEIVQYRVGAARQIGSTLLGNSSSGAVGYKIKYYAESDKFDGSAETSDVPREVWDNIRAQGFLGAMLERLKNE